MGGEEVHTAGPGRAFTWVNDVFLGEQPWHDLDDSIVIKYSSFIPVSRELLRGCGWYPWESPHRNPMPHVVLFPRLAHAAARARCARDRIRAAVFVLRHGLPEPEPEEDVW